MEKGLIIFYQILMKYLIDYKMKGGGYVLYCDACGAPLKSIGMYTIKDIEKKNKDIINKLPDSSYGFDFGYFPGIKKIDLENKKKYEWLNKLIYLDINSKNKEIVDFDSWDKLFKDKNGKELFILPPDDGIILHKDCYKLIKSKIGDFNYYNSYNFGKPMKVIDSHKHQDERWIDFFYRKEDYLLESPLKNKKNRDRITALVNKNFKKTYNPKLINKLHETYKRIYKSRKWYSPEDKEKKLKEIENIIEILEGKKGTTSSKKLKKDRPSPSESATQFKEGTKKKGNDGKMYVVAVNKNGIKRWKKI